MKKLFLFLVSLLALTPPLSAETITMFTNATTTTDTKCYYTNATVTTPAQFTKTASKSNIRQLKYLVDNDEVYCENINWVSSNATTTLTYTYNATQTSRYLSLTKSTHLKFSCLFGKITKVSITFQSGLNNLYILAGSQTTKTSSSATLATFVPNDDGGVVEMYLNASSTSGKITKIDIDYTPGDPIPPKQPALGVSTAYHYEYDKENNTISIPAIHAANSSSISIGMPQYGTAVYYTFNQDVPVPQSLSDIVTSNLSGWVAYTVGSTSSVPLANVKPDVNDLEGSAFKLRAIAYSSYSNSFGEELVTDCRYVRLPAPTVDKAKTEAVAGQKYDAATNTVTYSGANPVVYISGKPAAGTNIILSNYTTDFSDPKNSATKKQFTTAAPDATVSYTNWSEGLPLPPVGTLNQIKAVTFATGGGLGKDTIFDEYYASHNNTPFTVNVVRQAPTAPASPVISSLSIDGGNTLTDSDIPATIRLSEKAEIQVAAAGQVELYHKYFDHRPAASELTDLEKVTLGEADKMTIPVSCIDIDGGKTECWLALVSRSTIGAGDSDPLLVKIALKGPDTPTIDFKGGYSLENREYTVYGPSLVADFISTAAAVEYKMARATGGSWPETPDDVAGEWKTLTPVNGAVRIPADGIETGRLFYRAADPYQQGSDIMVYSDYAYTDFNRIAVTSTTLDDKLSTWAPVYGEGCLVMINEPVRVMGFHATNATGSPHYLYVINKNGVAMKLVGAENSARQWPAHIRTLDNEALAATPYIIPAGGIVGRLHFNDSDQLPEINITQGNTHGSESFLNAVGIPQPDNSWTLTAIGEAAQNPTVRTVIDKVADFGRYVEVRSLKWTGANNEMEMENGERIQLYSRLSSYSFQPGNLEPGKLYRVRGYVGLASGSLSLFPTEPIMQCPGTPALFAPNPITGESVDGFIPIQAVSPKVTFTVAGNADGSSSFTYTVDGSAEQPVSGNSFDIDLSALSDLQTLDLKVYASLNGMKSLAPACVRITKRSAEQVSSIEEFKTLEFERRSADKIYQITGKVLIEAKTDRYLYVRDYNSNLEQELIDGEHMRRLLILNNNLWQASVDKNGTAAPLEVGDVITGFAIATTHDCGNLLGNATGFARTFKFAGSESISDNNFETINASPTDGFSFSGTHRMRLVKLHAVQASRVKNTGDDSDEYPYLYSLTLDSPTRMRMDIFVRSGFAEAFAENTGFDLLGIPMLDNDDNSIDDKGKYAFALMSFEGSGKLAAPQVFIDGSQDNGDENISYNTPGTIVMTAPATFSDGSALPEGTAVTIHYSVDGLDPLKVITSRHIYGDPQHEGELNIGDGDIEIRAFAAAPGMTPSDVVVRRFRKDSHDVQFILNLLQTAKEGETYRFTGDTRVAAVGGDYLFVAGRIGHYLPVRLTGGWEATGIKVGDMLSGYTVGFEVDPNGNRLAVADGFEDTFKPQAPGEDAFSYEPDVTTALDITSHPRRLVLLKNVRANSIAARSDAQWSVTESGDNNTHELKTGILGDITVKSVDENGTEQIVPEGLVDGETYNILGFVMLSDPDREARMEIWPVEAQLLRKTAAVAASFSAGTITGTDDEGEITAAFDGMTMVTLSCPTHGAKIYYALGEDNTALTWYEYQRPFAVTADEYIHAKAEADGAVESGHTHIRLTALQQSGDVEFNAVAGDGVTTLIISPAADAPAGTVIWYSTGTDRSCSNLYREPLTYDSETTVHACVQEPGKTKGAVYSIRVMVVGSAADTRVSGAVTFTMNRDEETGKVYVTLSPENPDAKGAIYYTTETGVALTPETGTLYTGEIEVSESTYMMAILVETGKEAGKVCGMNIWVAPGVTGIDGIETDGADNSVRAEGDCIIAPEGSMVYDLTGRRVASASLRPGIYIVRTPGGKSVKIKID